MELDNPFNAHNDKTKEETEGAYMTNVHNVSEHQRKEEWESTIEDSQESCERHNWA